MKTLRIAMIIPDNRDERRQYEQPEPQLGTAPTALLMGLREREEVEVHVLSITRRPMRAPATLFGRVPFHLVPAGRRAGLSGLYVPAVRALRRRIEQLQPDVVHGQGTERYCGLAAVYSGRRNLITLHGNMRAIARLYRPRPLSYFWITAKLEGLVVRRTGGVLCLSRHSLREVEGLARRTWYLPNAVDPAFFAVKREPEPVPLVVCPANIIALKNQLRLMEALAPLAGRLQFRVVFAGLGEPRDPYYQEFQRTVKQFSWCQHEGFWSRGQLMEKLARATLMVLPSLEDNCPMALLEAMAAGVPVAAARVGGIPDLIEDGVNGVLFDPLNTQDMRERLEQMLEQAAWREGLASAGRQRVQERHTPAVVAAGHVEIYREIAGGGA
ncbi:MAG: glycosyltransferase family 4 protein [Verrucomicrobiae bacterium]|nr:glycosyltransferase family 4 protein [Verrucomicrobiae bacterium]